MVGHSNHIPCKARKDQGDACPISLYPGGDIVQRGREMRGWIVEQMCGGNGGMCKDLLMQLSIIRLPEGRIDYRCHLSAGPQA